ncbi:hypothetical protein [Streptomyces chattanoogensis]|uniref:hypothetical protein n=1 Tax=Streptomyces chattanoogensis TaxID=66876 RepID=UPI0036B4C6F2
MSYPGPPGSPGNTGAYGQQPQQGAWPQGQGMAPQPPPFAPPGPPAPQNVPPNAPQGGWAPQGGAPGGWAPQGPPAQGAPGGWAPQGGPGMPGMPPPGMPGPAPASGKSAGRACLTAFLAVCGGLGLLGGGGLVAHAYSNASQVSSNASDFGPVMWRSEPVAKLLPETLAPKKDYRSDTADPKRAQWHRVGISDQTACDDGLSSAVAAEAKKLGCKATLRATYVDPTGNTVVTVALIVLPKGTDPESMHAFFSNEQDKHPTRDLVKAYGAPGTLTAKWNDARRSGSAGDTISNSDMPYALAASAGTVDGRVAGRLPGKFGSHRSDARWDRGPWEGAAAGVVEVLQQHLQDLMTKETSH